jgi:hypothetical protein
MMRHTITISPAALEGEYRVAGAVTLTSREPVKDAARELLARSASERDTLHVTGADCSIADQPLWKLAAEYRPPLRSDMARQAR